MIEVTLGSRIHEYICEDCGYTEDILIEVIDEIPRRNVCPYCGGEMYKNFGTITTTIPSYMRAGGEGADTYDIARRAVTARHRRRFF